MNDKETLSQFIEATSESAKRSRKFVFILAFVSILAFISYWNVRPGNWVDERYRVANGAASIYEPPSAKVKHDTLKLKKGQDKSPFKAFVEARGIRTWTELNDLRNNAKRLYDDTYAVRVPFFGVSIDVNDLGVISGVSLAVLLILCSFSFLRELRNLRTTFQTAESLGEIEYCYRTLSMSQVLTVPPSVGNSEPALWSSVAKVLYVLPLVVQSLLYWHDSRTRQMGESINPETTSIVMNTSLASLVLIVVLTVVCVAVSIYMDHEWKEKAAHLKLSHTLFQFNHVNRVASRADGVQDSTEAEKKNGK